MKKYDMTKGENLTIQGHIEKLKYHLLHINRAQYLTELERLQLRTSLTWLEEILKDENRRNADD